MKTIGIYYGNFQPPHRGHIKVYKKLKQITGPETFIATTSKTPTPDAPLHFGEKENILVKQGVPASHIEKVANWKSPKEILQNFSPQHTSVVFAVNEKDFESLNTRKDLKSAEEKWLDNTGNLSYFQPYKGNEHDMKPFDIHGYVTIMEDNIIDGKPISTANIRSLLGSPKYTEDQKKRVFQWAFGINPEDDRGLFKELCNKFSMAHTSVSGEIPTSMPSLASLVKSTSGQPQEPITPTGQDKLQQTIKEIVKEMLEEFMPPPSMTPSGDSLDGESDNGLPGRAERRQDVMNNRKDAMEKKAASERDLKTLQADLKWKESDVKRKKKDEIPDKRDEIDALNKMAASGISPQ
jgi:hypothetical protein